MPKFEIQPCTEEDIPRFFDIISDAFAHDHEYCDAVFHKHDTPEGRKSGTQLMTHIYHNDPVGHFVKAVETETGKIVGAAKWNIYKAGEVPPQAELGGPFWPNEEEEEFAKAIFHSFFAPRQKVLEELNGRLVGKLSCSNSAHGSSLTSSSSRNAHGRPSLPRSGCGEITRKVGNRTRR